MSNPAYLEKIRQMIADGTLPQMGAVMVSHDEWCGIFKGCACNCNPSVKAQPLNRAQRREKNR